MHFSHDYQVCPALVRQPGRSSRILHTLLFSALASGSALSPIRRTDGAPPVTTMRSCARGFPVLVRKSIFLRAPLTQINLKLVL